MITQFGGYYYFVKKDNKHYTVLVCVPENHKPNTVESEIILILDGHDKVINDIDFYNEIEEQLISENIIEG